MTTVEQSLYSTMIWAGVLLVAVAESQPTVGQAADPTPQIVAIEGPFGKAEVNVESPSLVGLYLRGPDGSLGKSLLAPPGTPAGATDASKYWGDLHARLTPWANNGYTYTLGQDGRRYESRMAKPESIEVTEDGGRPAVKLVGVRLSAGADIETPATEDWTLSAPGDGLQLVWKIRRRWQKDFVSVLSGSPALFFRFDAGCPAVNSVTSTFWYDPLHVDGQPSNLYVQRRYDDLRNVSENHLQTIRDRDAWAIYKLWTNWHAPVDLRLETQGGHLYRRGNYASLTEAGVVTCVGPTQTLRQGQVEEITLEVSAVDKYATGYQLAVAIPDKAAEDSLKDFYQSLFNGGAINDQKGFDFGNGSDGVYFAGSCWMYGMALSVGTPAPGRLSTRPYDASSAFREHLAHVLDMLDEQGQTHFGFCHDGAITEINLHTILGVRAYLLHSGDLAFVRQQLPAMERMLAYFVGRRNRQGLFELPSTGMHWYYDAVNTSGVNGYYNAFFYKAASDLAEMEAAAGRSEKAREYRELADSIRTAFNQVLWRENAAGGPRYADWIDAQGNDVAYFCDLCQWPPIALGIASAEQARKIVATADARIAQLETQYGYQGFAGLSALWPLPASVNPYDYQTFGQYMNGGSLLAQTYWEVVARAKAGDCDGAARRLRLFAKRAQETSWAGDNAADIHGNLCGGNTELYLADMVVVTASLVHGLLGITPTWDCLEVTPCLPSAWSGAKAEILYKGRRHRVTIDGRQAKIEPLEQVIDQPLMWVMDFNLRTTSNDHATTANVDFLGPYAGVIALKKLASGTASKPDTIPTYVASGSYQSPAYDWAVAAALTDLTVAAELNGGQITATIEVSSDGFRTVASSTHVHIDTGVNKYPLDSLQVGSREVRVQFDLTREADATRTPTVDGFRVTAKSI